jgi:hypothetical protein
MQTLHDVTASREKLQVSVLPLLSLVACVVDLVAGWTKESQLFARFTQFICVQTSFPALPAGHDDVAIRGASDPPLSSE